MSTDIEPLLLRLSGEAAVVRKCLKYCERVLVAAAEMKPLPDGVETLVADLLDKQENGERMRVVAEYALKFKKTLQDKRQLDETIIENLIADARNAVNGIVAVGVVLKHKLQQKTS